MAIEGMVPWTETPRAATEAGVTESQAADQLQCATTLTPGTHLSAATPPLAAWAMV